MGVRYKSPYYTVYDNQTDEILAFGKYDECAKMLGVKAGSFYSLVSRAKAGLSKKYSIVVEQS